MVAVIILMRIYWNEPLTEPVALKSGARLHTLQDAAHFIEHSFPGPVRSYVFDLYTALLQASRTGHLDDRHAATQHLVGALEQAELI